MIKNLLVAACLAGAAALSAHAQQVTLEPGSVKLQTIASRAKTGISVKSPKCRVLENRQLAKGVALQKVLTSNGVIAKRLVAAGVAGNKINPRAVAGAPVKVDASDAITLNEGFEGWDGVTEGWLPEGWSITSNTGEIETDTPISWVVSPTALYMPAADGNYYAIVNYDVNTKDEWLVSPMVDLPESPKLYYKAYVSPAFLFVMSDETVNWETYEFIEKRMAANVQVLVRAEGETDWTVVKDYYEEYCSQNLSFYDLLMMEPSELENFSIDLSGYKGKRLQVAFRYYGTDGNTVMLDAVRISNPALEASYSWPLGTQFFGITTDWVAFPNSVPVNPVNVPLTWYNTSEDNTADFTWEYDDPVTAERMSVNTTDLTVTYVPDYSSDFTCRNNMFYTPKLIATAAGSAPGEAQTYDWCQFGGKAEWDESGKLFNFGFSLFNYITEGFDIFVVDNDMEAGIPIYGYSKDVDQYWTDYTFQGDEGEGDGVKLTGILNYYFTQEAPIVISGAWIHAKGQIGDNAEFTLDIIPLDDETGEMTAPIATAKCKGSGMRMDEGGMQNFYTVPFTFAEPVVLSQEDCTSFVVRLSGFNDPDNVTWFAPYQSALDNPDGYALGWVEKAITFNGETATSLSPVAYYTGLQSFDIVLDAAYPWLDAENTEVTISGEAEAEVALGSYYDGSQLTATLPDGSALPEWLTVTTEGRYGVAKALFSATGDVPASCTVKIAAPGVAKEFHVNYDGLSGVSNIVADDNTAVREAFDALGRRVAIDTDAKGLYLLRHSNGRVEKVIR